MQAVLKRSTATSEFSKCHPKFFFACKCMHHDAQCPLRVAMTYRASCIMHYPCTKTTQDIHVPYQCLFALSSWITLYDNAVALILRSLIIRKSCVLLSNLAS